MNLPLERATIDGMSIAYRWRQGSGIPLVLIHGFLVSQRCWDAIVDRWPFGQSVLTWDLPGFGESDRPATYPYDVQAFVQTAIRLFDFFKIPKVQLIGHSLGGAVALQLAAEYPDRVARLVLADPVIYPIDLPLEARLALMPFFGEILFKKIYARRDMHRYFRKHVYVSAQFPDENLLDYHWECFNRPYGREASYRTLDHMARTLDLSPLTAQVRPPVMVIRGEQDHLVPKSHADRLKREIPSAQVVTLHETGHSPLEENPDDFVAAVKPFLEEK